MTVGRQAERAALATFLDDLAGGPSAAILEAEPGMGKTTLWGEAIEFAQARGYRVLSCRPSGADAELSLVGLGDLLRSVPDEALVGLSDPQREALDVALLRRPAPSRRPDPRAVSVAALDLIGSLVRVGPIALAVDDVPWLDRPTTRVLTFVMRRVSDVPIRLLLTRPDPDPTFPLGLADALPPERIHRMALGPMPAEDLAALVRERTGSPLSLPEANRLVEVSGGNPFFALEIAHAVVRGDQGVTGQSLPIPRNLREDLVMHRLDTLPNSSLDLLLMVAAAARPTLDLLSEVAGGGRMPSRLQRAIDAGLVRVAGSDVRFTHPLYRSALYSGASRVRRHAAHRRLAELTSDPEERARHLALSAEGTDEAIATTLDTAASLARNRGAPDAAAELLEHAIRLTSATSVDDARRRHLEAADHRFVAGDQAGAEGHARRALELSRPGGERAEAMRRIAHLECERGAVLDARRSLEAAAAEPGASTAVSAAVLRDLADLAVDGGDLSGAEKHARTAEDLARRAGDPSTALAAHTTRARVALLRGDPSGSLTETRPDTSGATPAADPQNLLLAEAEMLTGRHDRARGRLETLAAAAHDRGDEPAHRIALVRLAELELRVGSWDRARSWAREALDLAGLFGVEGTHETALLAYLAAVEGLEDDCRTAARTVLRSEREDQVARLWSLGALGVLELSLGRADLAIRQLGPVGTFVDAMGLGEPEWLPFLPDEAEALVTVGEHEAADRRIAWLEARGRALGRDSVLAAAGRCRGSLLAATGNLAEALISAESAVELCGSLPLPFERGRCLLTLGVLRRRDRQKRDARDALGRALELFETLGARIWAERAREELARISGRRASLTELTESERRVVRLAAAGRTNQEIGQTLSMSVRTVEGHLSHAYAKLGLRSRTELAVFFTD